MKASCWTSKFFAVKDLACAKIALSLYYLWLILHHSCLTVCRLLGYCPNFYPNQDFPTGLLLGFDAMALVSIYQEGSGGFYLLHEEC